MIDVIFNPRKIQTVLWNDQKEEVDIMTIIGIALVVVGLICILVDKK